jgi:hypothetical protein
MTHEHHSPMPLSLPVLHRTFSNYDDSDTKMVEEWLHYGGTRPADEVIQEGFPVLYYQIYCEDFRGQPFWAHDHCFTAVQMQRWNVMESITGLRPIMNEYQNARRTAIQMARA